MSKKVLVKLELLIIRASATAIIFVLLLVEFDGINGVEKQYCKPVYTITDGYQLNHCVPCHSCFYETHCRDRCADSRRFEIRSSSSYLAPWLFPSVMPIAAILSICAST